MRILVGTDFHGVEPFFEKFALKAEEEQVDVMVVCGDVTHFGTLQQAMHLLSLLTDYRIPVFFVPGNCDPPSLLGVDIGGATCLHGKNVTIDEFSFIGIGGSPPTPFSTPFELSEEEIMDVLNSGSKMTGERLILVSHAPPRGTDLDKTSMRVHAGSLGIRRFVEERKPELVFCGHIHEARGKTKIGKTTIINPGPARYGNYALVLVDEETAIEFESF